MIFANKCPNDNIGWRNCVLISVLKNSCEIHVKALLATNGEGEVPPTLNNMSITWKFWWHLYCQRNILLFYIYKLFRLMSLHVSCNCRLSQSAIVRFRMVKIWFPQNTFFSWFFIGRAFIMVYYITKLVLEFHFDLQNPLKQPKILNFWKMENYSFWSKIWHFFAQSWSKTMYNNVFG